MGIQVSKILFPLIHYLIGNQSIVMGMNDVVSIFEELGGSAEEPNFIYFEVRLVHKNLLENKCIGRHCHC